MKRKAWIAAGGTGGHLFPAQQLASLLRQNFDCSAVFAGHKLSTSPFFSKEQFAHWEIPSSPLRANPLALLFSLARGTIRALVLMLRDKPSVVVGFGSFHTAPVLLAAALLRKKIVLYEPNRVMGKVNRFFAPFAQAVASQLPIQNPKAVLVPFFPWIGREDGAVEKKKAREMLGLDPDLATYLVFGGSQGASFLNETVPGIFREMQAIHLAGSDAAAEQVARRYRDRGAKALVKGFETRMALAYAASDFAICRSGAGTSMELIRYRLPALLVPYPHAADDHQKKNAEYLAHFGAVLWVAQAEASSERMEKMCRAMDLSQMRNALAELDGMQGQRRGFDEVVAEAGGWR